ncbi:hypothetical protein Naga_101254g2 [Nannochloropsis gaditana]|uniref:Uncharacterized protein n=1 Tax=Nannochloropsis gaditana TaxID=72520 RepID=W7U0C2_9STRA|nr:hypothetical protein Naga_101254g2 [Nannochloropsis gaditana]
METGNNEESVSSQKPRPRVTPAMFRHLLIPFLPSPFCTLFFCGSISMMSGRKGVPQLTHRPSLHSLPPSLPPSSFPTSLIPHPAIDPGHALGALLQNRFRAADADRPCAKRQYRRREPG